MAAHAPVLVSAQAWYNADAEAFAVGISVWGTTTICGNAGGEACP